MALSRVGGYAVGRTPVLDPQSSFIHSADCRLYQSAQFRLQWPLERTIYFFSLLLGLEMLPES